MTKEENKNKLLKAEELIRKIKDTSRELDILKRKLDELGLKGRKAVYFNGILIGFSYDVKVDRLNISLDGETFYDK